MHGEEHGTDAVHGMLDDLEMEAGGLHLADRAAEVGALGVAGYAEVPLAARLHASLHSPVRVSTRAGLELAGSLGAVGSDWLLVEDAHGGAWFVPVAEVVMVAGLVARSVPEQARPVESRLSLRSVLRRLSEERQPCAIHLAAGRVLHGVLTRVGADFVEVRETESTDRVVVPLGAIAALQERV